MRTELDSKLGTLKLGTPHKARMEAGMWKRGAEVAGARAHAAQLARVAPRWASLRELVGSDEAMDVVLDCLGPVGGRKDGRSLAEALALGRLVPGVRIVTRFKVGPAGTSLLRTDKSLGGLAMLKDNSWALVLGALKHGTALRELDLWDCGLGHTDVDLLAEVLADEGSCIAELSLGRNDLSGAFKYRAIASVLHTSTTLRVLDLRCCNLDGAAISPIATALGTNTGLKELLLFGNNLGDTGGRCIAAALATNATLRKLCLYQTQLGDGAGGALFQALLVNRALQELDVCLNGLGQTSGAAIADVLRDNTSLRVLHLSENYLRDQNGDQNGDGESSWPQVLAALQRNGSMQGLCLRSCALTELDGRALANALCQQPEGALRELNVSSSCMGDVACSAVVTACLKPRPKFGSALRNLNLANTGTGTATGLALARFLPANTSLQVLNLCNNDMGAVDVGDHGSWPAVFEALAENCGLRELYLEECELQAKASIAALATALGANRVLQRLELNDNGIGDEGGRLLTASLTSHTALQRLGLGGNDLGDAAILTFAGALLVAPNMRKISVRGCANLSDIAMETLARAGHATGCSIRWGVGTFDTLPIFIP